MVNPINTKEKALSLVTHLITGTEKHWPDATQAVTFGGVTRTVSALTQRLQSYVDLRQAVLAAQAATKTKIEAEKSQAPSILADVDAFVAFLRATYGNQPDVLADFGLAPRKAPAPRTAVENAAAAVKRAATRSARGTMGKVQKKAVKGNVTGVVVTPVTATDAAPSPAGAASPSPAAGAPAATTGAQAPAAPVVSPGR